MALLNVLVWLVALEALGLATLPLAHRLFSALPDRGYATSKILGLVLLSHAAWVTGILGITGFNGPTIVIMAAILGIVSWWLWGGQVRASWPSTRRLAIAAEVTFVTVFLLAVGVRAYNSAIAGQEKQMDMTFLHSLIQARSLPAEDLWFARFGMPYYYLGYLTQAIVAKVTGVDPAIAYNLAVASVLALSALGAFGLAAGLVRLAGGSFRLAAVLGACGAFILTIMGNLEALFEVVAAQGLGSAAFWSAIGIKNLEAHTRGFPPPDGVWWFHPARVIPNIQPDGITEFPYFSFLLGDLHPHYMAIPLGILIVTLAAHAIASRAPFFSSVARAERADEGENSEESPRRAGVRLTGDWVRIVASAIVLGAVILYNTWDIPVLWGLFGLAFLLPALAEPPFRWTALRDRVRDLAVVVGLAVLFYSPYFVGYTSQPLGLGITDERTFFGSLFVLFGPLLVLALLGGLVGALEQDAEFRSVLYVQAGGVVAGLVLAVLREPTLGFLVASLALWIPLIWTRARSGERPTAVMAALLMSIGLGSILVPEVIFLRDSFQSRMNTVFKFYYDAWILLALAAPLVMWELIAALRPIGTLKAPIWLRGLAGAALAVTGLLIVAGAIYPVAATHTKSGGFAGTPTLDGLSYLRSARPDDVAAIEWLKRNHPGSVVVEAVGNDYTDAARVSTFAGTPTLIGWVGHQLQWRGPIAELDRRQQLTRRIYTEPESVDWSEITDRLGVEFVVVGTMEREVYGPDVQTRIERVMTPVHRSGNTTIFGLRARTGPGGEA